MQLIFTLILVSIRGIVLKAELWFTACTAASLTTVHSFTVYCVIYTGVVFVACLNCVMWCQTAALSLCGCYCHSSVCLDAKDLTQ